MDRGELRELADAYGGDLTAWPEEEAARARALAARDPLARTILAEASELDALLARAPAAPEPSGAMFAAMAASFETEMAGRRAGAASPVADEGGRAALGRRRSPLADLRDFIARALGEAADAIGGRSALAGGVGMAAAAGLALGVFGVGAPSATSGDATLAGVETAEEDTVLSEDDEAFFVADAEGWFIYETESEDNI